MYLFFKHRPWHRSEADEVFVAEARKIEPLVEAMTAKGSWRESRRRADEFMAVMAAMGHVSALDDVANEDLLSEIAFRWRQTTTLYDWEALDLIPAQVAYAVLARLGLPSGILQAVERHFTERVTTEDDLIRWRRAMIVALPAQDECK